MPEPQPAVTVPPTPTTKIRPLYDRVICRRDKAIEKVGGIIIAETAKEPPSTGTIIAVGEGHLCKELAKGHGAETLGDASEGSYCRGCHIEPLRVKVGDRVLFQSYAGSEINVDGEPLLILNEADILVVYEE